MSGERIELQAIDGGRIGAWLARPTATPRGALVIAQEIFGVNAHIRSVCEDFAARGYLALAPAFFDRLESGLELDYDEAGTTRGRACVAELGMDRPLRDVRAAADWLSAELGQPKVGVIGYCWGGAVAFLAATRLGLPAASYYGRLIVDYLHERPQAPLLCHFGERDPLIPAEWVTRIEAALPQVPVHRYPDGHGFNRLGHPDGDPACAELARRRSLDGLEQAWSA